MWLIILYVRLVKLKKLSVGKMFSIIIPTYNNLKYLKLCLKSLKKNSNYNDHEIIIHVNDGSDGTLHYLTENNYNFTHSINNTGICSGMNLAARKSTKNYILYSHDDFYFCPEWDLILAKEINKIGHKDFYLSGTMMNNGHIPFDCGEDIENFDEYKFLNNYKKYNFYDFQGSTWAPTVVHKDLWNSVGGFSEEFFPGTGSDPDFNMKLWMKGVRIFKGINNFKVYHFGSLVLRKKINKIKKNNKYGSKGAKLFLLKWGLSIKFFKKFYLRSNQKYDGPLIEPNYNMNFSYFFYLIFNKINFIYIRYIYSLINKFFLDKNNFNSR